MSQQYQISDRRKLELLAAAAHECCERFPFSRSWIAKNELTMAEMLWLMAEMARLLRAEVER